MTTERKSNPASAPAPVPVRTSRSTERPRPLKLRVHGWLRWLHIYISMFSLLAILFFSLTGVTLNHPEWAFTNYESKNVVKGQLPDGWKKGKEIDWIRVERALREQSAAKGTADDNQADESEGSISFKAPGYNADCFFNVKTGSYDLTVTKQGFFGMMNDFHRGTEAGPAWHWVIDLAGLMLAIVATTGLGLLYYLKKIRVAAFMAMGVGIILIGIAMKLAF